jgi:hypothetical protein
LAVERCMVAVAMTPADNQQPRAIYRVYKAFPVQVSAPFLVSGLLLWASVSGDFPPLWFTAFWVLCLAWLGCRYLWSTAVEMELTTDGLRWRTAFQSGCIPYAELVAVRSQRGLPPWVAIELSSGRPVFAMASKEFTRFAQDLVRRAPHVRITMSPFLWY